MAGSRVRPRPKGQELAGPPRAVAMSPAAHEAGGLSAEPWWMCHASAGMSHKCVLRAVRDKLTFGPVPCLGRSFPRSTPCQSGVGGVSQLGRHLLCLRTDNPFCPSSTADADGPNPQGPRPADRRGWLTGGFPGAGGRHRSRPPPRLPRDEVAPLRRASWARFDAWSRAAIGVVDPFCSLSYESPGCGDSRGVV